MRINGEWRAWEDGILRPILRGEVLAANGAWLQVPFLVDTGADCTVFNATVGYPIGEPQERLGGVGGAANSVLVETKLQFPSEDSGIVTFHGRYAAFTELEALDMCVLGRDVLGLFAVIVDQPANIVCMLRDRHAYRVSKRKERG